MKWSAHTALPPAVAAAGSPAERPAAPACDGAGSGLVNKIQGLRTVIGKGQ